MTGTPDKEYSAMSEDEIDLVLGGALLQGSFGSKPLPDAEKRAIAQNWFQANMPTFRQAVCHNKGLANSLVGKEQQERNLLIGTVLDVALKATSVQVPVAALAAKILHYGVDRLCQEDLELKA